LEIATAPPMLTLEQRINQLADDAQRARTPENLELLAEFRQALNRGEARVVEPDRGGWKTNLWVKRGILLHLGLGHLSDSSQTGHTFEFDTLPRRRFSTAEQVRLAGDGAFIRDGACLAPGASCFSPCFVNMGVQVGADSVIDSNCMIGLCACIGNRVHIGPGVQIGGVVTPLEAMPSIIADDVVVGGNSGIYDGVSIGEGALLMPGTVLGSHTRLYDLARKTAYKASPGQSLVVPRMAVVAPGAVPLAQGAAAGTGVLLQAALIIAYRDDPDFDGDPVSKLLP
jgi:2,3,4,5-tetrahydropyridine-2,6-dicarboxylate N-succinyltransferase